MKRKNPETFNSNQPEEHDSLSLIRVLPTSTIRNLHGISLRNISFLRTSLARQNSRSKDDAMISTIKSTTARHIHSDSTLRHSRSISDLRSVGTFQNSKLISSTMTGEILSNKIELKNQRRRATIGCSTSIIRQRQLEVTTTVAQRTADVFYSLHFVGFNEPFYVSEVVERSKNPTFQFFDLKLCGASVCQQSNLQLKIWVKPCLSDRWLLLIDLTFSLKYLHYLGSSLDSIRRTLPENTILIHLTDGVYILPQPFIKASASDHASTIDLDFRSENAVTQKDRTSSYDALLKLSTLQECIQDAISIHHKLAREIDLFMVRNKDYFVSTSEILRRRDTVNRLKLQISVENHELERFGVRLNKLKAEFEARSTANEKGRDATSRVGENIRLSSSKLAISVHSHSQYKINVHEQRRRICEDLSAIYPISSVPDRPLTFTIAAVPLPNSNYTNSKDDHIAAALGHVAHCVHLLSQYLCIPLPYPIRPRSSSSLIYDPISITLPSGSRTFPLYAKGTVLYRFEYGVYLLNKDIEYIATRSGLRLIDIRQTLPNLKCLLFVATAGSGKIPPRRVGGVRGFFSGIGEDDDQTSTSEV